MSEKIGDRDQGLPFSYRLIERARSGERCRAVAGVLCGSQARGRPRAPVDTIKGRSQARSRAEETLGRVKVDETTRGQLAELAQASRGNLDKIAQHGKRADSIVKYMLLHSREGSGEHRPVDINVIVEESLNLAYHGARAEKQGCTPSRSGGTPSVVRNPPTLAASLSLNSGSASTSNMNGL